MKKLIAMIGMIACIFGLTACGETQYTDFEQQKINYAEQHVASEVLDLMQSVSSDANAEIFEEYTAEEVEALVRQNNQLAVQGNAVKVGITSYRSALDEIGSIVSVGEAKARIDGKQIIVAVPVEGEKKDAEAEIVLSNNMFFEMESFALNPVSSMGELMTNAALNTLIGMGTVFIVLILIIFVISALSLIPKLQAKFSKKEEKVKAEVPPAAAPAPVYEEEEAEDNEEEIAAVIAAAVAAYEGSAPAEGYVVRSIHRVNRGRR